jgi:hypothetical protein
MVFLSPALPVCVLFNACSTCFDIVILFLNNRNFVVPVSVGKFSFSFYWIQIKLCICCGIANYLKSHPVWLQFSFLISLSAECLSPISYQEMFEPSISNPVLWKCRSCGKQVSNRWHHYHSHTSQRSLCPYCTASYSRIDTLRNHIRGKHRDLVFKPLN